MIMFDDIVWWVLFKLYIIDYNEINEQFVEVNW